MKEALLYDKLEGGLLRCGLCSHYCRIADNKFGFCGVRQNIDGKLYTYTYGKVVALHVDPVEKKPLNHFLPGTNSFSLATIGCNFRCGFCQNWEISQQSFRQGDLIQNDVLPEAIVEQALESKCKSISYTYTEPTIFFEYALDIAKIAKAKGLANIFVTNGYTTKEALILIKPFLNAANVDLKFFNNDSYQRVCSAKLGPVLDSIKLMRQLGIWVEVTTLIIPGENDSEQELSGIAKFIASVDKDIPWHVSRFHPNYKFIHHPHTSEKIVKIAQEIGKQAGLNYIYAGNVVGFGNDTYCHNCRKLLIKREIFDVLEYNMKDGKCVYCASRIPGYFS